MAGFEVTLYGRIWVTTKGVGASAAGVLIAVTIDIQLQCVRISR
jgi:hypothetical protein